MRAWTLTFATLALAGCVSSDLDEYQPPPDAELDRPPFPERGISFEQTLEGIYAKRESDNRILVQKIEIVQTDVSPWRTLELSEARSIATSDTKASYAIIANRTCTSRIDMKMGQGQHVDWFILPRGRLAAYDHMRFHWMCAASVAYQPAVFQQIEVERKLLQLAKDKFPASRHRVSMIYTRGTALAWVGRVEDAEKMLALGDRVIDNTTYDRISPRQGSAGANIARKSSRDAQREQLVRAIQDAKAVGLAPIDAVPAYPTRNREAAVEDDGQRDRERWERWERDQANRRFVEVGGSFRLVDKNERRSGPREGEVWLTFDEMQLLRAEHRELRAVSAKPEQELEQEPPDSSPETEPPLFVEINGVWTEVDPAARKRGPKKGEVWVSYHEMQILEIERQLDAAEQ